MRGILNVALLCVGLGLAVGMPAPANNLMTMDAIQHYFTTLGYMGESMPDPAIAALVDTDMSMAFEYAIKIFQRRHKAYGLIETGELDEDTMKLISMPRCGMKDINSMEDTGMDMRKKRYAINHRGWPKLRLTYRVTQYPRDGDLEVKQVDSEVARAFKVWSDVTPLTFVRLDDNSRETLDIEIRFSVTGPNYHGDWFPFDGPSGVLAHAFFPDSPILPGDAHFDEAEQWTINSPSGTNFFQVAAHEFGHALGLSHSQDPSALMAPFYMGYVPNFDLPRDDIMGIQALYGPPREGPSPDNTPRPTVTSAPPTMKPEGHDICHDATFDAITTVMINHQKQTVGFRGRYYFLINEDGGIAHGYPQLISEGLAGLPNNIDAAVFWDARWVPNGGQPTEYVYGPPATFVFKGGRYWRLDGLRLASNSRPVSEWGSNFPHHIDAVIVLNGNTFIFKGDQYYKYRERYGILEGYPRSLSVWKGLPENMDAAMKTASGDHVFFKDNRHYAFDVASFSVQPGYPKHNFDEYFRCNFKGEETIIEGSRDSDKPTVDLRNIARH